MMPGSGKKLGITRFQWWAYSVPILVKTLGIVLLVSAIFGGVMYFSVRDNIRQTHNEMHMLAASRAAVTLASNLANANPLDEEGISRELDKIIELFPDISYILVRDSNQRILGHFFGFPIEIPPDLVPSDDNTCSACHDLPSEQDLPISVLEVSTDSAPVESTIRRFSRSSGIILEATAPIGDGMNGTVYVGHNDESIRRAMGDITGALLKSLLVCLLIGQGLAVVLAYLLVHPIQNLAAATKAIGEGDFSTRAKVFSGDEIGGLARAFNLMADKLEEYRREVEEKEVFQNSLLDRIVQAQEEERKSIARELHDQLGQSLYRSLLAYQGFRKDCGGEDARWRKHEDELCDLIDEVRRLAWEIRPSILDDFGLDSALGQYLKDTTQRTGLPIDYKCGFPIGGKRLPARIEVILYRIAQEAVTNIVRHAQANRASVVLLRQNSTVKLLVEDDGLGFAPDTVFQRRQACLGLMGMKERVSLAGGELTIDASPGKGVAIRAQLPIVEESACP